MIFQLKCEQDKETVISYIRNLNLLKRKYRSIIEPIEVKRTVSQNSLYWLWLAFIEDETGNESDDLHEKYFGKLFLPKIKKIIFGVEVEVNISTTELDTKEFSEYMDKIHRHMAEKGISLPQPHDLYYPEFVEQYKHKIKRKN